MKHKLPMYYGAATELFKFAEKMRFNPTDGEKAMWNLLKTEALRPYKFRRQHPISTFIADFYSHQLLLVIEIDGGYHLDEIQKEYDTLRDEDMCAMGITVVRFSNDEIIQNPQMVLNKVLEKITLQAQKLLDNEQSALGCPGFPFRGRKGWLLYKKKAIEVSSLSPCCQLTKY